MRKIVTSTFITLTALIFTAVALMLAGCGSGGGISSQVLSGSAAVGAPLAGQVSLKDSSSPPQQKTTVIGSDGSFAFDVTALKAPYILQGSGNAGGKTYTLHSFGEGAGIANINPLSNVVVAGAAGGIDPEQVYASADPAMLLKIKSGLAASTSDLLSQLKPLLILYSADGKDPIKDHYAADHQGLDGLLDNVTISIPNGVVTVINTRTGAVIFTANISDIKSGKFSVDPGSLPQLPALPVAPNSVSAAGGSGQVTLSWDAVSNATSYNLYYATSSGVTTATGTKIPDAVSPYVQAGLAAGSTYYYVATAVNSAGEGRASAQASAVTVSAPAVPTVPVAPSGVIATGGTKQVTLSWNSDSTATSYNVYYSTTDGVTKSNGTKLANTTTPAVQAGLTDATTYYYIIVPVNSSGEGEASVQVAATTLSAAPAPAPAPAVPTSLTAAGGAKQVILSWGAVAGASSYNVYWSATPGVTVANGTKVAGITSPYVNTGLSAGTAYYFVVTAANSAGESAASVQTQATTNAALVAVPAAPAGVTATGSAKQVSLSWPAVSGATSYNVYWSTASAVTIASGTRISAASGPYLQTGLAAGTTYYYVVTAVNSAGESPASARVTATTSAPVSKQLTLAWDPSAGATSYNLYWSTVPGVTPANGTRIGSVSSPYVHTGLTAGTTYYYVVTAADSSSESPASVSASGTTSL